MYWLRASSDVHLLVIRITCQNLLVTVYIVTGKPPSSEGVKLESTLFPNLDSIVFGRYSHFMTRYSHFNERIGCGTVT